MLLHPVHDHFLIARWHDFRQPWMDEKWWQRHGLELFRAMNAMQKDYCFALSAGPAAVYRLSGEQFDALWAEACRLSQDPGRREELKKSLQNLPQRYWKSLQRKTVAEKNLGLTDTNARGRKPRVFLS